MTAGHAFDSDPATRGGPSVHGGGRRPSRRDEVSAPDPAVLAAWSAEVERSRREYRMCPSLMEVSPMFRHEQAEYRRQGL